MRICYMGTPEFAVPALEALHGAGHTIVGVVTQPDKQQGRGMKTAPPPVKRAAEALGLPVLQPEKIRQGIETIAGWEPELIVVAAYGKILPKAVLDLPPYGCVNIHASLLPRFRGAAPIQRAVAEGEKESGVTTMYMAEGLDEGDMIFRAATAITPEDTGGSLHDRLMALGAELIVKTVAAITAGEAPRTPQAHALATYAPSIKKHEGQIDWSMPAHRIATLVRGFNPWPVAYTGLEGKTLKIFSAVAVETDQVDSPGTLLSAGREGLLVKAGSGAVRITELQAAGKRRMTAEDYLRGHPVAAGAVLGGPDA
ncbi:methionyl-tRNA formyltransferase [Oscillospiraceae bacterium OttesenSCG-928-F05]|nr:methionyl-tRNA formyltransferase [Oscillospiraceae bacterium OttesenSCG-928-F05]